MNEGALNTFALNGSVTDPTVTSVVQGYAYATAAVLGRMRALSPFTSFASAESSPVLRGLVRDPVNTSAQAVSSVAPRVFVRSVISSLAQATATVTAGMIRSKMDVFASAIATVVARVSLRSPQSVQAKAEASPVGLRLVRDTAVEMPEAQGSVGLTAYLRRYIGERFYSYPEALGAASLHSMSRAPVNGSALAEAAVMQRVFVRSALSGTAEAAGYVDGTVAVYVPFDEPAIEEHTFIVPPATTTFMVT